MAKQIHIYLDRKGKVTRTEVIHRDESFGTEKRTFLSKMSPGDVGKVGPNNRRFKVLSCNKRIEQGAGGKIIYYDCLIEWLEGDFVRGKR